MVDHLRFRNPATMPKPPHYSHVVEMIAPGRVIWIAGQVGANLAGDIVGVPGDFRAQAMQTFGNLKNALAEAGATFDQVVKVNSYLVDLAHLPIFREVRDQYFNASNPPAVTTLKTAGLVRDGALLEVEAIAVLPFEDRE